MAAMMPPDKKKNGLLARYVPILHWLPHYNKAWLTGDVVAGLSVWALMVPQCLGFAAICGVPVQYGLYAAAIALIVYAFFASSRHVVTGPSSTIAAVTGAAVLSTAKAGSSEAIALVAAITLLASWIASLPQTSTTTLIVGAAALVILIVLKIYAPRVPGALVTLVLGIGASAIFDLSTQGVAVVGKVPRGLPIPALPDISLITKNFGLILSGGLVIIRFDGPLYFATANALRDKVREVTTDVVPPVKMVLIDMEGVNYIDLEGSDMLNEITKDMREVGVEIHLARVKHEVMALLEKDGVDKNIGRDHIHNKVFEAVQLFTQKD